jgi:hypothetical protein
MCRPPRILVNLDCERHGGACLLTTGDYSFPGSAWERNGVEAPTSRLQNCDAFQRGRASLALSYQAEPGN